MPERVLNVNRIDFGKGGVPVIAWRWGLKIDPDRYIFDYLGWDDKEESEYTEVVESLGGRIFSKKINSIEVIKEVRQAIFLKKFVKENHYKIVHIQGSNSMSQFFFALASKAAGADKVIVHAHSAHVSHPGIISAALKRLSHEIFKQLVPFAATDFLACSTEAGNWMYPRRVSDSVKVINNGIDVDKFAFNERKRKEIRENLWQGENLSIIGHVGRFAYQKNHEFLVDVFNDLYKEKKNARLLLIGQGELEDKIHEKIHKYKLDEVVCHIKSTPDVNQYMQAMDIFLLPSVYEGLGIVVIEAQAAGLPVIVSDKIPKEAFLSDLVHACPIDSGTGPWVETVCRVMKERIDRTEYAEIVRSGGFSIEDSTKELENIYRR